MSKKLVILKRVFLGLAAVVVLFVGVVAMQPGKYRIERSATLSAPAASAFAQVNDFRKWQDWSPWEKLDPNMKKSFEGSPVGVGSVYAWDGNDQAGAGRMTLLESRPDELIRIKLDFVRPFEDSCTTEFAFKPKGSQTEVTWSMAGEHTFISKAICLFMNMDKMVGGDFEKGLAQIKAVVENPPAQANAAEGSASSISR